MSRSAERHAAPVVRIETPDQTEAVALLRASDANHAARYPAASNLEKGV